MPHCSVPPACACPHWCEPTRHSFCATCRVAFDDDGEAVYPPAVLSVVLSYPLDYPLVQSICSQHRVVFDDDGEAVDPLALLAKEEEFGEEEEEQAAAAAGG